MKTFIEQTNEEFKSQITELTEEDLIYCEKLRLSELLRKSKSEEERRQIVLIFLDDMDTKSFFPVELYNLIMMSNIVYVLIEGYMKIIKNRYSLI